jgi:DNA-binding transcriptional MocR family regulator
MFGTYRVQLHFDAGLPPRPSLCFKPSQGGGKISQGALYISSSGYWLLTFMYRTIVNDAAAASPKQPIVNLGQGFFGYNPPQFIIDAAKDALDKVECNQYSPTKGRPRLKKAIADAYSPLWGRKLNPETEVTITTGANEGRIDTFY